MKARIQKKFDNISFIIPAKKITAIVGVSGRENNPFIKLLLGFYNPVKGDVLIGGTA